MRRDCDDETTSVSSGGPAFACPAELPATATARSPVLFRTWIHGTVAEIGAGGARLAVSAPAGLCAGTEVAFTVTVPFSGAHDLRADVVRVVAAPGGRATIDIRWVDPPVEFLREIAEYLLLGRPELTPAELRAAGLPARGLDRAVTYGSAGAGDLDEILELRLRAHRHEGRLRGLGPAELASPFDTHACHLVCRHGSRIVGYVRVIFVGSDPDRSQYVSWGGHVVPRWMWRAGFVEGGAGAVDPDFQRAGLFLPLVQHVVRVAVESGHRHVLGACEDELLPMYESAGYRLLETRRVEPRPGWEFRSNLIHLDIEELLAGRLRGRAVPAMEEAARFGMRGARTATAS